MVSETAHSSRHGDDLSNTSFVRHLRIIRIFEGEAGRQAPAVPVVHPPETAMPSAFPATVLGESLEATYGFGRAGRVRSRGRDCHRRRPFQVQEATAS